MQWVAWGVGNFFQTAFNHEKHAIDRLVDSNPVHWGKYVHGYIVEDPAVVLPDLAPSETTVLIFAIDKAAEIKRAVSAYGAFHVLAMGDVVRTTAPQWSDFEARRDMTRAAWEQGTRESADYVYQHMKSAKHYWDRATMLKDMMGMITLSGLVLEFGVAKGISLGAIASSTSETVHGFDSFEGLPEAWGFILPKGAFSGDVPGALPANVEMHVGLFDETLPRFVVEYPGPVAFLHVDSDIYSSAKTIFKHLGDRILPGTVIVFDEYLNYPGWREHEFKAFKEFIQYAGLRYEYLGVVMNECQAAVRII